MCVEWLKKGQHALSRALWEEAFPEDSAAFLDAYYAEKGCENEISVMRDETGMICSMIHWNPRTVCFFGHDVPASYLVAVATGKKYRRQGLMRRLMTEGLHACESRGLPFVFLTPARDAYYTPFGFAVVSDAKAVRLTAGKENNCGLQKEEKNKEAVSAGVYKRDAYEVWPLLSAGYASAAMWCNLCLSEQYTFFVMRNEAYFARLALELASEGGGIMAVYVQNGGAEGAGTAAASSGAAGENVASADMTGQPTKSGSKRLAGIFLYTTDGGLEVREPVCMRADKQLVYGAICDWVSQKKQDDRTQRENTEKTNSRIGQTTDGGTETKQRVSLTAKTMVRILSLEKCAACLRSKELLEQRIHVSDPLFAHNNGDFLLRLSPDGCSLTRIEASDKCGLYYTIEEITALLFAGGYQNEIV